MHIPFDRDVSESDWENVHGDDYTLQHLHSNLEFSSFFNRESSTKLFSGTLLKWPDFCCYEFFNSIQAQSLISYKGNYGVYHLFKLLYTR